MNLKVDFKNLTRQLLPNHKRQPVRLMLLQGFVSPLIELFRSFDQWRGRMRIETNMTGQVGVLEGYLRAKYNNDRIVVETFVDHGFAVGMIYEGEVNSAPIGLSGTESKYPAIVPLHGELREAFGDVDFCVYIPAGYSEETLEYIRIDIDRFKQVLVKYKIIKQ